MSPGSKDSSAVTYKGRGHLAPSGILLLGAFPASQSRKAEVEQG